jgi:hypothetical protein
MTKHKKYTTEIMALVACLGLLGSACGAADEGSLDQEVLPRETLQDNDQDVAETAIDEDGSQLGTAHQALTLMPFRGGGGGNPDGFVQAGDLKNAAFRTGDVVDQLMMFSDVGAFGPWGGGGGSPKVLNLFSDDRIVGIWGYSARLVDSLGFIVRSDRFGIYETPAFGGGGGEYFRDQCPDGTKLIGLNVRSGTVLDAIQAVCG